MTVPFKIPASWAWCILGDLVSRIEAGKSFTCQPRPARDHEWGVIKVSAMTWGEFREQENKAIPADRDIDPRYEIRPGDILVSRANTEQYVGAPVLVHDCRPKLLLSDKSLRLIPAPGVDAGWLLKALASPFVRRQISARASGQQDSMRNISQQALLATELPVPPLAEQRRIVAALESHLSHLSAAADLVQAVKLRAKVLRDILLDGVVEGKLRQVVLGSGEDDSFSELEGRVAKRIRYDRLPFLPDGWKWRVAHEVCSSIVSGSTPAASLMYAGNGEVPFLKVYNLAGSGNVDFSIRPTYVDRSTHEGPLRRSRVRPGDVLTNIVGPPLGKTAVVPPSHEEWNINQAIVSFRAGRDVLPQWLALALQSPLVLRLLQQTAKATAGQFNIALSTCRELPLPIPPLVEQERLVETVDALLTRIKVAGDLSVTAANLARRLRESVLAEAFAGRLVAQDPNDEPASELLARIRAERAAALPKQKTLSRRTQKELPAPSTRVIGDDYQQEALPL